MAKIHWLPKVQNDLSRLYNFIEPHNQSATSFAVATIHKAVETKKK